MDVIAPVDSRSSVKVGEVEDGRPHLRLESGGHGVDLKLAFPMQSEVGVGPTGNLKPCRELQLSTRTPNFELEVSLSLSPSPRSLPMLTRAGPSISSPSPSTQSDNHRSMPSELHSRYSLEISWIRRPSARRWRQRGSGVGQGAQTSTGCLITSRAYVDHICCRTIQGERPSCICHLERAGPREGWLPPQFRSSWLLFAPSSLLGWQLNSRSSRCISCLSPLMHQSTTLLQTLSFRPPPPSSRWARTSRQQGSPQTVL